MRKNSCHLVVRNAVGGDLKVLLLRKLPSNPKNKCLGMNQWLFSNAMKPQGKRNTVYELELPIYDRNQN